MQENLLITSDGHLLLSDFGLSKAGVTAANLTHSLSGTVEYLAPEVLAPLHARALNAADSNKTAAKPEDSKAAVDVKSSPAAAASDSARVTAAAAATGHGPAVDWWQFGLVLHEMLTGTHPFYSPNAFVMHQRVLFGSPVLSSRLPAAARHLIQALLCKRPEERLGMSEGDLEQHPFFSGGWCVAPARTGVIALGEKEVQAPASATSSAAASAALPAPGTAAKSEQRVTLGAIDWKALGERAVPAFFQPLIRVCRLRFASCSSFLSLTFRLRLLLVNAVSR